MMAKMMFSAATFTGLSTICLTLLDGDRITSFLGSAICALFILAALYEKEEK